MVRLLFPRNLARREFGQDLAVRDEIVGAWRKSIFAPLPAKGVAGCRLLKAYVTTARGPQRTLFLLQAASGDTVFLMHRPKGDPIGAFAKAVDQAMSQALRDIVAGDFDVEMREKADAPA
jgi:hypothetical protein